MKNEHTGPVALPLPRIGAPPQPHVPEPSRMELDNGLRLVAVPCGTLPQVILRLVVPGGSVRDPVDTRGLANFTGQVLTEGTELRTADELNAQLDRLGASLDVHVGHDFSEVELSLLSETLPEALALFAELVMRPAFPHREVERVRREALDALAARYDEPANVADDRVARAVFGDAHPYGYPSVGTADGVGGVRMDQIRAFHHDLFRPEGSVLVAAGQFDAVDLAHRLELAFRGWAGPVRTAAPPAIPTQPAEGSDPVLLPWAEAQQSEIRFGGLGLPRASLDWIPAAVANYIIGGSTITGRLGANLREDKGWTYGARSAFSAGVQPGGWIAETAVDVAVRDAAIAEFDAEIRRMVESTVSDEELERAQRALELSLPRAFETPARVASRFVTLEAFGLPADYWETFPEEVRSVTADKVLQVARRYLQPGRLVRVVVG